jgi:hypothetical protein
LHGFDYSRRKATLKEKGCLYQDNLDNNGLKWIGLPLRTDSCARRQNGALGDDHDPIFDRVGIRIKFRVGREGPDDHILTHAHIFIDDGTLNIAIFTNPDRDVAAIIIVIGTHHDRILNAGTPFNDAANSDHGVINLCSADNTALTNENIMQLTIGKT